LGLGCVKTLVQQRPVFLVIAAAVDSEFGPVRDTSMTIIYKGKLN
jgi:hypothetical protein